jgi:signal transduction histidine kinase
MTSVSMLGWALAAAAVVTLLVRGWAGRERRELVARACHEVRGPLTAVRLGLAALARAGDVDPALQMALDLELGRATLALDDLGAPRAAGAVRRGRMDLDRVDLAALLDEAVLACGGRAAGAGASVRGGWEGPSAIAWGDRLRLAQILGNVLANAIEHGGPTIDVRGGLRDGVARLEISDDGPGLPAPVAELARRPRGGRGRRGRGLAIAVAIAEAHGGALAAAPVGHGGRIVLTLPAAVA